jgi:hypothetical protein
MKAWDVLKKERIALRAKLHFDPLAVHTWDCNPLLVIDSSDGSIAFCGRATVTVKPHTDLTADLNADHGRDGWLPSLVNARITPTQSGGIYSGHSNGFTCTGKDRDGFRFVWYVNGAADYYGMMHPCAAPLAPEEPPDE